MQIFTQTLKVQVDKSSDVYGPAPTALMVAVVPALLPILPVWIFRQCYGKRLSVRSVKLCIECNLSL